MPDGRTEDVHDVGDAEAQAFVEPYVLQLVGLEEALITMSDLTVVVGPGLTRFG